MTLWHNQLEKVNCYSVTFHLLFTNQCEFPGGKSQADPRDSDRPQNWLLECPPSPLISLSKSPPNPYSKGYNYTIYNVRIISENIYEKICQSPLSGLWRASQNLMGCPVVPPEYSHWLVHYNRQHQTMKTKVRSCSNIFKCSIWNITAYY